MRVVTSPTLARSCPVDRRPIDSSSVYPDNAAKLEINSLKVKCPNERNSCDWVGEHSDAQAHIDRCGFACVSCPQCDITLKRAALVTHASECPKRLVVCAYCSADYPSDQADAHRRDCTHVPEQCPNRCGEQTFPRCDLKAHLEGECPLQEMTCELSIIGCSERVKRNTLSEHLITCSSQRAGVLAQRVVQQEAEITRLNKELAAQAKEIQLLRTTMYPCSGQFTWCVSNIRQKIRAAREGDPSCTVIYSPEFLSREGGYLLQLCIYPTGDKATDFMSLYLVVMKGPFDDVIPWPFQQRVMLTLLSCYTGTPIGTAVGNIIKEISPDPRLHYFNRPKDVRNVGFGYPKFIQANKLEADNSEYVGSGCIYLRAVVM